VPEHLPNAGFRPAPMVGMVSPLGGGARAGMQNHHPNIAQRPDRAWVVECAQCRNDVASAVPIGIGMPLRDRETAERLRDNHAARGMRAAAS
jgi:hypothetical protein